MRRAAGVDVGPQVLGIGVVEQGPDDAWSSVEPAASRDSSSSLENMSSGMKRRSPV